jgi:hypothetical protein
VSICHTAFSTLVQHESVDVGRGKLRQTDRDELGARAKEHTSHTCVVAHNVRRQAAFLELITPKSLDELLRGTANYAGLGQLTEFTQIAHQRLQASIRHLRHETRIAPHLKKLRGNLRSKLANTESAFGQPLTELHQKPTV